MEPSRDELLEEVKQLRAQVKQLQCSIADTDDLPHRDWGLRGEDFFHQLLQQYPNFLILFGRDLHFEYANQATLDYLGYTLQDVLGQPLHDLVSNRLTEPFEPALQRALDTGQAQSCQATVPTDDGEGSDSFLAHFIPLMDENGQVERILSLAQQTTMANGDHGDGQRRQAILDAIFSASPAGIGTCTNRVLHMANRAFCEMIGRSADELIGQDLRIVYPDQAEYERIGRELYSPLETQEWAMAEATLQRSDGTTFPAYITAACLEKGHPERGITFTVLDMTTRKMVEQELRDRTAQLESAQKLARLGSWILDVPSGEVTWSQEMYRLFDRDPALGEPSVAEHRQLIHPDDYERCQATVDQALASGEGYVIEFRIITQYGQLRHLQTRGEIVTDPLGRVVRLYGTTQDITDRVLASEQQQLTNLVVENTPAVLFRWSGEDGWPVEFVTHNVSQFGYRAKDLLAGKIGYEQIVHPADREAIKADVARHLADGDKRFQQEYRIVSPTGDERWVDDRTVVHYDENGNVTFMEGVVMDITDRVHSRLQSEQLALQLQDTLESISDAFMSLDEELTVTYFNPAAEAMLDKQAEDVLGQGLFDVFPEARGSVFHQNYTQAVQSKKPMAFEAYFQPYDTWYDVRVYPRSSGISVYFQDVTERKQAEQALQRSEERFRQLFDAGGDAIYVHPVTTSGEIKPFTDVNDYATQMTGYSREELLRMSPSDLDCPTVANQADIVEKIIHQRHLIFEVQHRAKDGRVFPVEINAHAFQVDGEWYVMSIARDITERKKDEQALRDSEERYRRLFNAGSDAIFAHPLSEQGELQTFTDVNDTACRMTGYSRDELLQMTPADIDRDKARCNALTDIARQLIQTGHAIVESIHTRKDGSTFPVEVNAHAFQADGQWQVLSSVRDITDRKRAQAERDRLQAQIQHTQKLESLGVLAGGIAHDFNNLLMGILGNADLALMELSPAAPARSSVDAIKQASGRAAELCRQMLAYSGKGRFVIEPISLAEIVEEMGHMLDVSISKKAVLKYHFDESTPATMADATQIRQVIMNLITNASEAIGDRSGIISVTIGAMDCSQDYLETTYFDEDLTPGLYVTLEVADTGCGMDDETASRLFEPFFTTKFTGRGLGLAAVMGIVRGHKGAIKVYSELGRGTTVRVLLPACDQPPASTTIDENPDDAQQISGTVLLADDEETVRAVGKRMLEKLGCSVFIAADGREAIDIFQQHADQIDLVILDLTMPHIDGEEAYRQLRRIKPDIRAIVSSGYNEQEVAQRFIGKGLAGFIQKPYQLDTLKAKVRSALA